MHCDVKKRVQGLNFMHCGVKKRVQGLNFMHCDVKKRVQGLNFAAENQVNQVLFTLDFSSILLSVFLQKLSLFSQTLMPLFCDVYHTTCPYVVMCITPHAIIL